VPESQPPEFPADLNALFGELFGQFFSGRTLHLLATLAITDAEAATGVEKELELQRAERCVACGGRGSSNPDAAVATCESCGGAGKKTHAQGFFQVQTTCPACKGIGTDVRDRCAPCDGHGTTLVPAKMTIEVPACVEHEQELLFAGKGSEQRDGSKGDLRVRVLVGGRPDSRLTQLPPEMASLFAAPLPAARIHQPASRSMRPFIALAAAALMLLVLLAILR
jgi:molecular chaperone DnaJ